MFSEKIIKLIEERAAGVVTPQQIEEALLSLQNERYAIITDKDGYDFNRRLRISQLLVDNETVRQKEDGLKQVFFSSILSKEEMVRTLYENNNDVFTHCEYTRGGWCAGGPGNRLSKICVLEYPGTEQVFNMVDILDWNPEGQISVKKFLTAKSGLWVWHTYEGKEQTILLRLLNEKLFGEPIQISSERLYKVEWESSFCDGKEQIIFFSERNGLMEKKISGSKEDLEEAKKEVIEKQARLEYYLAELEREVPKTEGGTKLRSKFGEITE